MKARWAQAFIVRVQVGRIGPGQHASLVHIVDQGPCRGASSSTHLRDIPNLNAVSIAYRGEHIRIARHHSEITRCEGTSENCTDRLKLSARGKCRQVHAPNGIAPGQHDVNVLAIV